MDTPATFKDLGKACRETSKDKAGLQERLKMYHEFGFRNVEHLKSGIETKVEKIIR